MRIGIILAMQKEYNAIARLLGSSEGRMGGNEIKLGLSGFGKVNAALAASGMISGFKPDCIISAGCAGGLAADVKVMDVVAASQIVYHDVWCGEGNEYGQMQGLPARFDCDPALLATAAALDTRGRIHSGLLCSGDSFIDTPDAASRILELFPEALASDMESAALAQVCHLSGIPFLSLRVISDSVNAENRLAQYYEFWDDISDTSFGVLKAFLEALD